MLPVSLLFLMSGLVLGVFAMLFGTERRVYSAVAPHERRSEHDPAAEPSPALNLASVAAFAFGFGLTAYLLTKHSDLPMAAQAICAGVAGGAAFGLQAVLIARWAIPSARAEAVDQRYLLQGAIGSVSVDIPANGAGVMQYRIDEACYNLPARSLDNCAVPVGTDVVIDRVEDGVAHVELWALVEARL